MTLPAADAMKVLALDTATAACSVAVTAGARMLARRSEIMVRGHAEALMPMVEAAMAEAGLGYGDLDLVATTVGPGSFTGLRIGLATARGIALAAGVPVTGATTLEVLAHGVSNLETVVAVLTARRGEVYAQAFDRARLALAPAMVLSPVALAAGLPEGPLVLVGDGAEAVVAALDGGSTGIRAAVAPTLPDAAVLARLCADRVAAEGPPARPPSPLYVRPPGARPSV